MSERTSKLLEEVGRSISVLSAQLQVLVAGRARAVLQNPDTTPRQRRAARVVLREVQALAGRESAPPQPGD